MSSFILKHKIGLPVWDDDRVVDIKHLLAGETVTTDDLEQARQSEEQQAELIQHNCYTAEEIKQLEEERNAAAPIEVAFVTSADEPLPTQEER